ncbi:MAG: NAD(+)/NADH kinase [Ilumatobacteraceae bacterium]
MVSTVGLIVNPHAGKDIRRLISAAGQTSDAAKISILRRVAVGALEQGAERLLLSSDTHQLAERAVDGLDGAIEFIESPLTGSHLDTIASAAEMWKHGADVAVALGGDGTCRDVATGWPQVPLIAISTGTNNVFPSNTDGTTAGVAAALIATGAVTLDEVSRTAKRIMLDIDDPTLSATVHETALVEAALIHTSFVGARAVSDPSSIRWVVACIANPASTGLASIAGRVHPVERDTAGGVVIHLGHGPRLVRVPLAPGAFATLSVDSVEPLPLSTTIVLPGGGVLAFDGERTLPVRADARITVSITQSGPRMIDIDRTLAIAARDRRFDRVTAAPSDNGALLRKDPHGD